MSILNVIEQGAVLHKKDQRILVKKDDQLLQSVPVFAIEQVLIFGNVSLTAPVRSFLLENRIDTVFLTRLGRFRGRLTSFSGSNIELRREQFRRCDQDEFVLQTSRLFVKGKIKNSRAVLRRHQRRVRSEQVENALLRMRRALKRLAEAETVDQARGHEGDASAAYFGCLSQVLKQPEFQFRKRTRRPPKDPFNSLLSFGYTILLGSVMTAVQTVGLEPYLGFLHSPANGKPSVGLDLMEEFRPLLVDALVIRMINLRQFEPTDFQYQQVDSSSQDHLSEDERDLKQSDYPVLLGRLSIKKWLATYHKALDQKILYPRYGQQLSYKQIVLEQARLLGRHIQGRETYQPFEVR